MFFCTHCMVEQSLNFEFYFEQDADEFDSLVLTYMLDRRMLLNKSFGKVSPEEALLIEKLVQESSVKAN